ncbi:LLM class flavin-dependent oxidoreductase [Pseudonocardia dioxanivorans]|uniref:LLM class flavin-dependent oxidoreductase n=1 Tax=Pseudonocardia dioxanivorans TaxID=240495 RepID=UPI000CD3086B|nr:LLM class flavin-dependent oxidoreductase [Pseudonocardia dioxanivorans]
MPVEFVGNVLHHDGTEFTPRTGRYFDRRFVDQLAGNYEYYGWDRVLLAYSSGSLDPGVLAAHLLSTRTDLKVLLAHRPNAVHPTSAARRFASLDQLGDGRLDVHLITGGLDLEQRREGDYLSKDDRYARTGEYIDILRRAWTSTERFSHHGTHYRFDDFGADFLPHTPGGPGISFAGSSAAAFDIGAPRADTYALWGEPLTQTAEQIAAVHRAAEAGGRPAAHRPGIMLFVRPILAPSIAAAHEKAAEIQRRLEGVDSSHRGTAALPAADHENEGSRRLLRVALSGSRHDRAGWTLRGDALRGLRVPTIHLVGTPELVAEALLDYVRLGVTRFQVRGYEGVHEPVDFGRYVIPLVRDEVARLDSLTRKAQAGHA